MTKLTRDEIMAARTPAGGWTKAQFAKWGITWPPTKGWIERLTKEAPAPNAHQVARANAVIKAWRKVAEDGADTQLRDLLADLMHWSKANDVDFDHELSMATDFFGDEQEGQ